ncbi:hypothetical protein SAMN05192534_10659 [Alteribacillus persepolensis]|uniref:UPF0178 protein SAMN05192534_10659 n=1 Tax=Alteribacillus persepolensis TaxID=568899 RepID=A0A1G8CRV9_9BACI|nr:DUF188 domain-containing protein [Alteribacillus persepolensis]SDH48231.1 hypothetical protein SAMN05192534_10659 [Alteribacillus persepolensis]
MVRKGRTVIVIFTDADACPVKADIDRIAQSYQIASYFVFTFSHISSAEYYSKSIMLDAEPEAVDMYIINHVKAGDVVITQDNGLAAVALQKEAVVLSPRGRQFQSHEIDGLLLSRYEGIQMKRGKVKRKSTSSFSRKDRERFVHALTTCLTNV